MTIIDPSVVLPKATAETAGVVKVGSGLAVDDSGALYVAKTDLVDLPTGEALMARPGMIAPPVALTDLGYTYDQIEIYCQTRLTEVGPYPFTGVEGSMWETSAPIIGSSVSFAEIANPSNRTGWFGVDLSPV